MNFTTRNYKRCLVIFLYPLSSQNVLSFRIVGIFAREKNLKKINMRLMLGSRPAKRPYQKMSEMPHIKITQGFFKSLNPRASKFA